MTSKELLYVKTVVEEGSISAAAKKLFLSQPSLSQSLQRIENKLSCALFIRTGQGLRLTFAGEKYYQAAVRILKIYEDMQMQISDIQDLKMGKINIGITAHLGRILLPPAIAEFKKDYPNIEIHIVEDTSAALERLLVSGEIDFALMHVQPDADISHLECEILAEEEFVILSSAHEDFAQKAKQLEGYDYPVLDIQHIQYRDFISLNKYQGIRRMNDLILKNAGISGHHSVLTVKSYMTALEFVALGLGIMIFPKEYIHYYKSKGEFITQKDHLEIYSIPKEYKPSWNLCIAYPKCGFLSKADEILLHIIKRRSKHA